MFEHLINRCFDVIRSPVDARDWEGHNVFSPMELPSRFSTSDYITWIKDQGNEGACAGFSTSYLRKVQENVEKVNKGKEIYKDDINPFFIYNMRPNYPAPGANLRDIFKVLQNTGCVWESQWCGKSGVPPKEIQEVAGDWRLSHYASIDSLSTELIKQAIYQSGGAIISIPVYSDAPYGKMWVNRGEEIGGHALYLAGWDDEMSCFFGPNSWGSEWGEKRDGWFYLPYNERVFIWEVWASTDAESPDIPQQPKPFINEKSWWQFWKWF